MLVSKRFHQAEVKRLETSLEEVKAQYEARISELRSLHEARLAEYQERLTDLHKLVFPAQAPVISKEALEVDAVLTGAEKSVEMSEEERTRILNGQRELDLIMSGEYDTGLLN